MDILRREELEELAAVRDKFCTSIYMPTHVKGVETLQDHIRLKNLLKRAEQELDRRGMRPANAREMLAQAQAMVGDYEFWQYQREALAMFAASGFFRYYRVPLRLEEMVSVGDRFYLKPLLRLLSGDGRFYVLALSGGAVRLLQCTRFGCDRVDLPDSVPRSFDDAQRYLDEEKQRQWYPTTAPLGGGTSGAIVFGSGTANESDKKRVQEYFHAVDKGLHEVLREDRAPMVFAGVEYLLPIYREASHYQNLLQEGVFGNPEGVSDGELHNKAWALVEPLFRKEQTQAAEQFKSLQPAGRASHAIKEVVAAAHQGRVDTLFVATGLQHWGRFDASTYTAESHHQPEPGDEDLLDLAAQQTLLNGGKVYAVDSSEIPDGAPLAAVYRY